MHNVNPGNINHSLATAYYRPNRLTSWRPVWTIRLYYFDVITMGGNRVHPSINSIKLKYYNPRRLHFLCRLFVTTKLSALAGPKQHRHFDSDRNLFRRPLLDAASSFKWVCADDSILFSLLSYPTTSSFKFINCIGSLLRQRRLIGQCRHLANDIRLAEIESSAAMRTTL